MKEPSSRHTALRRPLHGGRPDWAKVDSFIRTAMRMGAGDDIGALTASAKKRRFVLDGRSLRLVAILLLVLALSGAIGAMSQRSTEVATIPPTLTHTPATSPGESAAPAPSTSEQPSVSGRAKSTPSAATSATIVVHVSGAVGAPGIVNVPAPARVHDAITAAGGATENADLSRINLAQPIEDGAHIHVPGEGEQVVGSGAGTVHESAGSAGTDPRDAGGKVNINTADHATLQKIPGIGPVTAKAIIAWRTDNGSFSSVDQLIDVTGIGPKTLEQLREHVCI